MIIDNTWYYTLSTIAQTLAAILGLAVIFATIRLQNIIEKLKDYKDKAYYISKKIEKGKAVERSASGLYKNLKRINKEWKEKYKEKFEVKESIRLFSKKSEPDLNLRPLDFIKYVKNYLGIYINERKNLFNLIKRSGIVSSVTIIYVIFLLSISELIFYLDVKIIAFLFILAVILSILSIFLIGRTSWKLLKDSAEKI